MRKPDFCICKNKEICKKKRTAKLNSAADLRVCFCYLDSTIPLLPKKKKQASNHLLSRFVSDLVGTPEDRFSCDTALIMF